MAQKEPPKPDAIDLYLRRLDLESLETKSIRPEPEDGEDRYRFDWNSPVLLSPHVGGGTGGGQRGMIRSIVENLQRVARGDPAVGLVTMSTPEGRFET